MAFKLYKSESCRCSLELEKETEEKFMFTSFNWKCFNIIIPWFILNNGYCATNFIAYLLLFYYAFV